MKTFLAKPIAEHIKDVHVHDADPRSWASTIASQYLIAPDVVCVHHPLRLWEAMEDAAMYFRESGVLRATEWHVMSPAEDRDIQTEMENLKGQLDSILSEFTDELQWWSDANNRPWISPDVLEKADPAKKAVFFEELDKLVPEVVCPAVCFWFSFITNDNRRPT